MMVGDLVLTDHQSEALAVQTPDVPQKVA